MGRRRIPRGWRRWVPGRRAPVSARPGERVLSGGRGEPRTAVARRGGAMAALALAAPTPALGEDEGVGPADRSTGRRSPTTDPRRPTGSASALEELFGVGGGPRRATPSTRRLLPSRGFPIPIPPWPKLTFRPGTWTFDADDYGTNMVGHVAAGTVYYLIARGNRVSIPEAFGWTFGASLLWELVEYKEPVSINDMIMTPVGRPRPGGGVLAAVVLVRPGRRRRALLGAGLPLQPRPEAPRLDRRGRPDRDPRARGWHEFAASGGVGFLHQGASGATYPVAQLGVGTRLFRAPGYGEPGRARFSWDDGNASRLGLGMTFAAGAGGGLPLRHRDRRSSGTYVRDLDGDGRTATGRTSSSPARWATNTGSTGGTSGPATPRTGSRWCGSPASAAGPLVHRAGGRRRWGSTLALTFGGVQPFALQRRSSSRPAPPSRPCSLASGLLLRDRVPGGAVGRGPVRRGGAPGWRSGSTSSRASREPKRRHLPGHGWCRSTTSGGSPAPGRAGASPTRASSRAGPAVAVPLGVGRRGPGERAGAVRPRESGRDLLNEPVQPAFGGSPHP